MKKFLAILLATAMLCTFLAIGASAEVEPIDQALLEEALGYLEQARDIFDSGTYTLKAKYKTASKLPSFEIWPTWYYPTVLVFDKENDRYLCEIGMKELFRSSTIGDVSFEIWLLEKLAPAFLPLLALVTGPKLRMVNVGDREIRIAPAAFHIQRRRIRNPPAKDPSPTL